MVTELKEKQEAQVTPVSREETLEKTERNRTGIVGIAQ